MPRKKPSAPPPPPEPEFREGDDPTFPGMVTHEGKPLPPRYVNGKFNPLHMKAKFAAITDITHRVATAQLDEMPRGLNVAQAQEVYAYECKLYGLDPKHAADTRTDAEKMLDAVDKALNAPESIFEFPDAELDLLEQEFQKAVDLCEEELHDRRYPDGMEDDIKQAREKERWERQQRGKQWLNRVRRVKRLREWVRASPVPKGTSHKLSSAFEAAKVLLFMLYVTRSSMKMDLRPGRYAEHKVHLIGPPHARFSTDTWEAENGVAYIKGCVVKGKIPYEGVILQAHPGLGKSSFVMAHEGYHASTDPMMQAVHLHAKEDKAAEKLAYVKAMFDENNPMGRRREALFPGLRKTQKYNDSLTLNLHTKETKASPTLQGCGVKNAGLGGDTNRQYWDDVVPQSDRDQPTERARRFDLLAFTWKTRNRGKGFIILSGYPWHNDDAMQRHVKMALEGKIMWLVSRQPAGGPRSTPMFESVWDEVYPSNRLKALFEESGRNHALWSANYELNPISDEGRRIKCVKFYCPLGKQSEDGPPTTEHADFIASAQMHLSADPTATSRETSDYAGLLYGGLGDVRVKVPSGEEAYDREFRLVDFARLHLGQIDLTEHIAGFVVQRPTFMVHLEVRSNSGSATKDLLMRDYGLEVQVHDPTNKSKDIRLKSCAGLIDNSARDFPAKVAFPGVWENGKLVCDPRWLPVVKQLTDFGVESADEFVDALTQIVNWFMRTGELVAGNSGATAVVKAAMKETGDPRIIAMLKEYENNYDVKSVDEQEAQWMARREER